MVRDWLRGRWKRLRALVQRRAAERELDEEVAFHVEAETARNLERGMEPEEARRAARVAFGGVERFRERARDGRRVIRLEDAMSDAAHGLRSVWRRPVFAVVAVATLALGIGVNSALFGLVNALAFRLPTGVGAGDRLVRVDNAGTIEEVSYADYADIRDAAAGQVELAAWTSAGVSLVHGDGDALRVAGQLVSGNWFGVLGVTPVAGRPIHPADDRTGEAGAVVIGHRLWRDRFGADLAAIGTGVRINGHPFTIVGVAPEGFRGLDIEEPADAWIPISAQSAAMPREWDVLGSRRAPAFQVVGRLPDGPGALQRAAAAVSVAAASIEPLERDRLRPLRPEVVPLRGYVRADRLGSVLPMILIAAGMTVLVLLVACANVANLLLARALARRREIGIRIAIGAGRARLVRLLLAEALVLALCAVPPGVLIAYWGASLFQARFGEPLAPLPVSPDGATLAFTAALAVATGIMFGLVPALRASRPDVTTLLGAGHAAGPGRPRLQRALVVAQLAVSLVLLVTAALFLRRLDAAGDVHPGYDADRVLAVSLDLSARGYGTEASDAFHDRLREALRDVPGIQAISTPAFAPFGTGAALIGATLARTGGRTAVIGLGIAPDWFGTLGIAPLRGRTVSDRDITTNAPVVVISESLARRMGSRGGALGGSLVLDGHEEPLEVIGIVPDILVNDLHDRSHPQVFLPYTRHFRTAETTLLVRAADPAAVLPRVRAAVRRLDPHVAPFDIRILAADLEAAHAFSRGIVRVVGGFGVLALALAALGLYGVMALAVNGRTREIGIRIALGARPRTVVLDTVREGIRLAVIGLVIGSMLAVAFARLLASAVDGIRPADPAAAALAGAVLLAAAILASWLPARRAARVDPQTALRID